MTLPDKLESKNDFTLQEAMMMQKEFFEDIPIELLFYTGERGISEQQRKA